MPELDAASRDKGLQRVDKLATQFTTAVRAGRPLEALGHLATLAKILDGMKPELVDEARALGAANVELAKALQVSDSAITQRYGTKRQTLARLQQRVRDLQAEIAGNTPAAE